MKNHLAISGALFTLGVFVSLNWVGNSAYAQESPAAGGSANQRPIELIRQVREPASRAPGDNSSRSRVSERSSSHSVYDRFAEMSRSRMTLFAAVESVTKDWPDNIKAPLLLRAQEVREARLPELTSRSRAGRLELRWPPYTFRVETGVAGSVVINGRSVPIDESDLEKTHAAVLAEVKKIFAMQARRTGRPAGGALLFPEALADGGALTGATVVGATILFYMAWGWHDEACATTETHLSQCTQNLEELGLMRQKFLAVTAEEERARVVDMNGRVPPPPTPAPTPMPKLCPTEEQKSDLDDIVALPAFRSLRLEQDRHRTGFFARFGICAARDKLRRCLVQAVDLARGLCLDPEPTSGRLSPGAPGVAEGGPRSPEQDPGRVRPGSRSEGGPASR